MRKLVGAVACVVLAVSSVRADWPQFGGPDRDNVAKGASLAKAWPADGPKVLWTIPMGEGFGAAAIRDGEVYVLDRIDNQKDVLRCLDLKTGKELWTYAYDAPGKTDFNGSRAVPSVSEKYVFACGPFGQLTCVDRKTHEQVWQTNIIEPGAKTPPWAIAQNPLLFENAVITSVMSNSGGLIAHDQATGKVLWKSRAVPSTAYVSPSLVEMGGKPQLVMVSGKGASGVDPRTGNELWNFPNYKCSIPIPNVTVVGDPAEAKLLVTGGYKAGSVLIQLKPAGERFTATELWRIPQGSQIHPAIMLDGKLYFNGNSNDSKDNFTCIDPQTGNVLWQAKEPKLDRACVLLADGMFFMIDGGGTLHMTKAGAGKLEEAGSAKLLQPKDAKDFIWAPIALSDGVMVIRDQHQMKAIQVGQ